MSFFDDDDKIYVSLSIRGHGKDHSFNAEYDDSVVWGEVLDDIVKTLESSWGYSFDLDIENPGSGTVGIYYRGKDKSNDA